MSAVMVGSEEYYIIGGELEFEGKDGPLRGRVECAITERAQSCMCGIANGERCRPWCRSMWVLSSR